MHSASVAPSLDRLPGSGGPTNFHCLSILTFKANVDRSYPRYWHSLFKSRPTVRRHICSRTPASLRDAAIHNTRVSVWNQRFRSFP